MVDDNFRPFADVIGGSGGIGFELGPQFIKNVRYALITAQDEDPRAGCGSRTP